VKLIFAVDSIFAPLTGIGRYAWELAQGLAQEKADIRYFSYGRFVANPTLSTALTSPQTDNAAPDASLSARLRANMARSGAMVKLYGALSPHVYRWRLRHCEDHLFHSPNYFLPPFDGPSVATIHDLSTLLYPEFHPASRAAFMNAELPKITQRASHLITDSEFVRRQVMAQFSWPAHKVTAIALGVDVRFHPRNALETREVLEGYGLAHGCYTLCVATIEPRKNIERLIQAHLALPEALRLRYPLVLAGSAGWNSEALHQRIEQLQGPGLRYLRYVPQERLHALYAGARLFAFPSIYEGFGLPVLEAMASGVPVLISDSTSLSEVGGTAAWKVNPLDVDAIRDGLAQALQDEPLRAAATVTGLARARELSWERCYQQTRQLYRQLLAKTTS